MDKRRHRTVGATFLDRDLKGLQVHLAQSLLTDEHIDATAGIDLLVIEDEVLHECQHPLILRTHDRGSRNLA